MMRNGLVLLTLLLLLVSYNNQQNKKTYLKAIEADSVMQVDHSCKLNNTGVVYRNANSIYS